MLVSKKVSEIETRVSMSIIARTDDFNIFEPLGVAIGRLVALPPFCRYVYGGVELGS